MKQVKKQHEADNKQSFACYLRHTRWLEMTHSSEASVDFQWTTRRYSPRDRSLHKSRCKNLKSYTQYFDSLHVSLITPLQHLNILLSPWNVYHVHKILYRFIQHSNRSVSRTTASETIHIEAKSATVALHFLAHSICPSVGSKCESLAWRQLRVWAATQRLSQSNTRVSHAPHTLQLARKHACTCTEKSVADRFTSS
jgi:hypothetical protein